MSTTEPEPISKGAYWELRYTWDSPLGYLLEAVAFAPDPPALIPRVLAGVAHSQPDHEIRYLAWTARQALADPREIRSAFGLPQAEETLRAYLERIAPELIRLAAHPDRLEMTVPFSEYYVGGIYARWERGIPVWLSRGREAYRVVVRRGNFVRPSGEPFSTLSGQDSVGLVSHRGMWVMDERGRFYAAVRRFADPMLVSEVSLAGLAPVVAAGDLGVAWGGDLMAISDRSVYYPRRSAVTRAAIDRLKAAGLRLRYAKIELEAEPLAALREQGQGTSVMPYGAGPVLRHWWWTPPSWVATPPLLPVRYRPHLAVAWIKMMARLGF